MSPEATAIAFANVSYRYPGRNAAALSGVDWDVPEGSFTLVAGPSGSGKSTLLRCFNGLVPHFTGGQFGGSVTVGGADTRHYPPRAMSREVGFVFQDPEGQFVTGRVEDELAFGMEQLGVPVVTMRKRVEEVLDLLGIAHLRERSLATLSGGERQRVAVAAALALQPKVLVLDEPTSQLDPWGAEDVLAALQRLNDDLGLTVILAEHRLERVVGHVDHVRLLLDDATLDGDPATVLGIAPVDLTPPIVRLGRELGWSPLPLTIKEGRRWTQRSPMPPQPPVDPAVPAIAPVLEVQGLVAGYGGRVAVQGVDLAVRPGELVAVMGRNGSGKTTLLRTVMGFHRATEGWVLLSGRDATRLAPAEIARDCGYLPQDPTSMLFNETVREELAFTRRHHPRGQAVAEDRIGELLATLDLTPLADAHPHDLSSGERERLALGAIVVAGTPVLLLDEPTRGMDYRRKAALGRELTRLREAGVAIVMATHDVELVATIATRVVLMGEGKVIADGGPRTVLSGSMTFATQVNKLYGGGFLTVEDVIGRQ